jgi:hypothetical protein
VSEEFIKWMLGGIGVAGLAGIAALWNELRNARKETMEVIKTQSEHYVTLTRENIESRKDSQAILTRLVEHVQEIPCAADKGFPERRTPYSSGQSVGR